MCPFLIGIVLVSFLVFYRCFKKMMLEKVEEIELKIGCLETKIDELYTIIYNLGNTIKVIQDSQTILPEPANRSRKSEVAPQKKQKDPNSPGAIKARRYREKRKAAEIRSEKMKASWEKRRENARAVSAEEQLQLMLAESKSQHKQ